MPRDSFLILGGTREAAALAARLVAQRPDAKIVTSLAGRTKEPAAVAGEVRTGGFGGAEGLADYLRDQAVTHLVDATHPFAARISVNAAQAAAATGTPLVRLVRPAWTQQPGDNWLEVTSLADAAAALPSGAVAFLALGSQHLAAFAARAGCRCIVRMVDRPDTPLPFPAELVIGKPSPEPAGEEVLFRRLGLTHLVCRNSGGDGGHAKIAAARALHLPVVMIARPPILSGETVATVDQAIAAMAV